MSYFGTDGIRGKANQYPITPDMMMKTAMAAAQIFTRGDHRHTVVIGKDTRQSGYMIETALTSGFAAMGVDVALLGPLPTPAVANLTRAMRADLGVMISASHNPYHDNGIKFLRFIALEVSDALGLDMNVAQRAGNMQAIFQQIPFSCWPDQKSNITTCLMNSSTEIAADCSGAKHQNSH